MRAKARTFHPAHMRMATASLKVAVAQNFVIMLATVVSLLLASVAISTGESLHVGLQYIHDPSDLYRTAV